MEPVPIILDLVEGILDRRRLAVPRSRRPLPGGGVERARPTLDLDDEYPVVWVREHEVNLTVLRIVALMLLEPAHVMQRYPGVG